MKGRVESLIGSWFEDKNMKRSICLFLAMLMLLGIFAGCKNTGTDASTADTGSGTVETSDADSRVDNLPELDYQGKEVNIYTWSQTDEWLLETENLASLSRLDYANYKHLKNVEDRLGIVFNIKSKVSGNWGKHVAFIEQLGREMGDSNYDIVCQYSLASIYGAQQRLYMDLNTLPAFNNWEGEYWNENLIESNSLNGKTYYVTGDMTSTTITRMGAVVFNRDLAIDYFGSTDVLYGYVDNYEWTLDKVLELCSNTYEDLNNNQLRDPGDFFGFVVSANNQLDLLQYGANIPCITHDVDGMLTMNPDFTAYGEKTIDLVNKVKKLCWDNEGTYLGYTPLALQSGPDVSNDYIYYEAVQNKCAIFQTAWVHQITDDIRSTGVDYGILPIPMSDSNQREYHTALEMTYSMFSIPKDCKDPEMSAYVLEALSSDGHTYLVPEIFEKLIKYQYVEDEEDARMFDLLRNGIIYEPGRIFSSVNCFSLFRLATQYNKEWTSYYMLKAQSYQDRLDAILAAFQG